MHGCAYLMSRCSIPCTHFQACYVMRSSSLDCTNFKVFTLFSCRRKIGGRGRGRGGGPGSRGGHVGRPNGQTGRPKKADKNEKLKVGAGRMFIVYRCFACSCIDILLC